VFSKILKFDWYQLGTYLILGSSIAWTVKLSILHNWTAAIWAAVSAVWIFNSLVYRARLQATEQWSKVWIMLAEHWRNLAEIQQVVLDGQKENGQQPPRVEIQ
jgi:hypothetical protein